MAEKSRAEIMDEHKLIDTVRDALATYLYREARRFGLSVDAPRVTSLCHCLLAEPPESLVTGEHRSGRILQESALSDSYYSENLEVHDYLHLVSLEMRKRLGQYITPSVIVRYILDTVGYRVTADTPLVDRRLIDPACGSGIFLVEAIRVFLAALRQVGEPIEMWYPRVQTNFAGVDIDPIACLYTRLNVSLLLAPAILSWACAHPDTLPPPLPIHCLDTLRTIAMELDAPRLFSYDMPSIQLARSFDFVIGNPPYHKIGRLDEELKQVFRASLYGHPNAYGLFLHAGLEMLRPGGVLGYIVPRSMLSGLYFKNLRRFLEQQASLREVTLIAERKKIFRNVLQGTMVLALERRSARARSLKTSIARSIVDLETRQMPSVQVSQTQVIRHLNGTSVWFVADNARTYQILNRIIGHHPLLSSPEVGCPAKTGQIVWNRVKPLLRSSPEADTLPLVWATDVGRFAFSFASASENRPPYLKVTSRTYHLVQRGISLLVQRVTADEQPHRLVACVAESFCAEHPTGYFLENHLNLIQPSPFAPGIDLYYLLGLLCSDVIEFFFRTMNGNTQVSATELNFMPIPRCDQERECAALARKLQDTLDPVAKTQLERELNTWIAQIYGLSSDDLEFIQQVLAGNHQPGES